MQPDRLRGDREELQVRMVIKSYGKVFTSKNDARRRGSPNVRVSRGTRSRNTKNGSMRCDLTDLWYSSSPWDLQHERKKPSDNSTTKLLGFNLNTGFHAEDELHQKLWESDVEYVASRSSQGS